MTIIGIDPGYAIVGWAVFRVINNNTEVIDYGAIEIPKEDFYSRLNKICLNIEKIIKKHKPDEAAIEKLFFNKNLKTAIDVSQVRGAIASVLLKQKIKIYDYTPLQVKQALVGYGRAEKYQIQNMVKILLKLNKIPEPDDVADALAIGVCHINTSKFNNIVEKSL